MLDRVMSPLSIENNLIYKNKTFFYVLKRDKVSVFIICSSFDKNMKNVQKSSKKGKKSCFLNFKMGQGN